MCYMLSDYHYVDWIMLLSLEPWSTRSQHKPNEHSCMATIAWSSYYMHYIITSRIGPIHCCIMEFEMKSYKTLVRSIFALNRLRDYHSLRIFCLFRIDSIVTIVRLTSDIRCQVLKLLFVVQNLNRLCVGIVAHCEWPWNGWSIGPVEKSMKNSDNLMMWGIGHNVVNLTSHQRYLRKNTSGASWFCYA